MDFLNKNKILNKIKFDELYNSFLFLDKKQQYLVAGVIVVALLLVLILPVNFVSSQLNAREEEYNQVAETAAELYAQLNYYKDLKGGAGKSGTASQKLGADPLKRIVYQFADEIGIEQKKVRLKTIPTVEQGSFIEEGKELTIQNIDFSQMVDLLEKIAAYPDVPINIKKMTAKADRRNKQSMNNVVMTISILQPNVAVE
ncbi:MAG: hypothetical protein ABII18_13490 [bacterium]